MNVTTSSIKGSYANTSKEEDTCNKDNYKTLKDTQIDNNTEENIGKINDYEKDNNKKIVEKIKK